MTHCKQRQCQSFKYNKKFGLWWEQNPDKYNTFSFKKISRLILWYRLTFCVNIFSQNLLISAFRCRASFEDGLMYAVVFHQSLILGIFGLRFSSSWTLLLFISLWIILIAPILRYTSLLAVPTMISNRCFYFSIWVFFLYAKEVDSKRWSPPLWNCSKQKYNLFFEVYIEMIYICVCIYIWIIYK